jgi:hexosaminidase
MILIPEPNFDIKYSGSKIDTFNLRKSFSLDLNEEELFNQNNIKLITDPSFDESEYMISIEQGEIKIIFSTSSGLINAKNTLRNILINNPAMYIPEFFFRDKPKYQHREFMLDTARNFFSTKEIKKILNEMSLLKLNIFHWHLTDNESFSIESKKYPILNSDKPFYSYDDIKEVVSYAKKLGIDVIPEIDMPSHSRKVVEAYKHLGKGNTLFISDVTKSNSKVRKFVEDILEEVVPLFPYKYFHIGGDEVNTSLIKQDPNYKMLT